MHIIGGTKYKNNAHLDGWKFVICYILFIPTNVNFIP